MNDVFFLVRVSGLRYWSFVFCLDGNGYVQGRLLGHHLDLFLGGVLVSLD